MTLEITVTVRVLGPSQQGPSPTHVVIGNLRDSDSAEHLGFCLQKALRLQRLDGTLSRVGVPGNLAAPEISGSTLGQLKLRQNDQLVYRPADVDRSASIQAPSLPRSPSPVAGRRTLFSPKAEAEAPSSSPSPDRFASARFLGDWHQGTSGPSGLRTYDLGNRSPPRASPRRPVATPPIGSLKQDLWGSPPRVISTPSSLRFRGRDEDSPHVVRSRPMSPRMTYTATDGTRVTLATEEEVRLAEEIRLLRMQREAYYRDLNR
jgi:hypothetical protein